MFDFLGTFWRWTMGPAVLTTRGRVCLDDALRDRVTLSDRQDGLTLADRLMWDVALSDEVALCP